MKIEVDTQRDSKEDIMHLVNMLSAISGSRRSRVVKPKDLARKSDLFEDSSPSSGLFNLFGDSSSQSSPQQSSQAESQHVAVEQSRPVQSGSDSLFSIFSSSGDSVSQQSETPSSSTDSSVEKSKETSSADDILSDDQIVPY